LMQELGNEDIEYETISFSILASEGRAAVALIWWKGHDRCLEFARSYAEQRQEHYTTLAIQACFEHLENTCVRPEWWEAVRPFEQKLLVRRLLLAGGIHEGRDRGCLQYTGVTHDDWEFDELQFLNA
jgi:hypothetical protein